MRLLEPIAAPGIVATISSLVLLTLRHWRPAALGLMRALTTIVAITAVVTIATVVAEALAIAPLVAPEGAILAIVAVPIVAVVPVVSIMPALLTVAVAIVAIAVVTGRGLLHVRLRQALFAGVAAIVLAEFVIAYVAWHAHAMAAAIHALTLRIELFAIGHNNAAIVFGMLEIIFRQHRIARRLRVARQGDVFFCNVSGRAPDLNVGAIGFEAA